MVWVDGRAVGCFYSGGCLMSQRGRVIDVILLHPLRVLVLNDFSGRNSPRKGMHVEIQTSQCANCPDPQLSSNSASPSPVRPDKTMFFASTARDLYLQLLGGVCGCEVFIFQDQGPTDDAYMGGQTNRSSRPCPTTSTSLPMPIQNAQHTDPRDDQA